MFTSTLILLIIATALLIVAAWAAFGARGHHVPIWPAAVAILIAVTLFGVAAFTA